MPLEPAVCEDLLTLIGKYPDLTAVQRAVLKSAAAFLVQDELDGKFIDLDFKDFDPRLKMTSEEYEYIPNRIELWSGIPRPKDWETPNRLAAAQRERAEIEAIRNEGFSPAEVWNEWERRRKLGKA